MPVRRFAALSLSFSCFLAASAKTPDTATLTGRVQDQTQAGLAVSTLTITGQTNGITRTTQTDAHGRFFLPGLPSGDQYELRTSHEGFAPTSTLLALSGGNTATVIVT